MHGPDGQENIPHREWLISFDRIFNEVKAAQSGLMGARVYS